MSKIAVHVFFSLIFSFIFNIQTVEAVVFSDNFDTYTPGDIAGQGPWTYVPTGGFGGGVVVTTTEATSTPNSVEIGLGLKSVTASMSTSTNVYLTYYAYLDATGKSDPVWLPGIGADPLCNDLAGVWARTDGYLRYDFFGSNSSSQYINGAWNKIELQYAINGSTTFFEVKLNDVEQWTILSTSTVSNAWGGCMRGASVGTVQVETYIDNYVALTDGDAPTPPEFNDQTRIISFSPADGSTTTSPVTFDLQAYINEADIDQISTIQITLQNIDQNVLLLGFLSPASITFVDQNIDTPGFFNFSTSTVIADGNYRIEACLKRTFFGQWFGDFLDLPSLLSDITNCESHQFVVGTSTFIGNMSQQIWGETNEFFNGLSATSSEAMAVTCNPLSTQFDVRQCFVYLTVPDSNSLKLTMEEARGAILTRWPWGYATRFVQILASPATSSLPVATVPIFTNTGFDTTLTFDFGDMVAGGGALLAQANDPVSGKTVREIFEPFIILFISALVIIIIVTDLFAMGRDRGRQETNNNKYG